MTAPSDPALGTPPRPSPEALLQSLLYAVSHDLRSPLLTLSLSGELIEEALRERPAAEGQSVAVALDAMRQGAADLERMLQALTALSRAYRRILEPQPVTLRTLLGGHIVISDPPSLSGLAVAVDPRPVRELIERACATETAEIQVERAEGLIALRMTSVEALPALGGTPLEALAGSLKDHAGTTVQDLAALQIQIQRQGGALRVDGNTVRAWIPLARGGAR
jgi:hypothetical protein